MTALFFPPKFASGVAGAKLYFTLTETTTPQDVFQDENLGVAHSHPVEADADGVFPPIYLDGRQDSYRVRYETAAGVLIYQIDGYPSSGGNSANAYTISEKNNPRLNIRQTQGGSGRKNWIIQAENDHLAISLENDAFSTETDCLVIDRSGNNATEVAWRTSSHTINDDESHRGGATAKAVGTNRNSSAVLTADSDLVLALASGRKYLIEGELYFYATTTAGMGFKFDLSYSGSVDSARPGLAPYYVNGTGGVATMAGFPTTPVSFATISTSGLTPDSVHFSYLIDTASAGNLSLRWAQVSSGANNLTLADLSWIRATVLQ